MMTWWKLSSVSPPFNDAGDRRTPDALKAEAHEMTDGLFESWIRTAGAAGLAVASRLANKQVVLFERSAEMADYARRSILLP
ncbi:hypothetical protein ACC685_37775, partial [Rhizobium ruizarguesonis]